MSLLQVDTGTAVNKTTNCTTRCDYCGRCVDDDYRFYILTFYEPYGEQRLEFVVCERCYDEVVSKVKKIFSDVHE